MKTIYCSNGKVGSTTVATSLRDKLKMPHPKWEDPHITVRKKYLKATNFSAPPGYYSFTFVRHPFIRLLSGYIYYKTKSPRN